MSAVRWEIDLSPGNLSRSLMRFAGLSFIYDTIGTISLGSVGAGLAKVWYKPYNKDHIPQEFLPPKEVIIQ